MLKWHFSYDMTLEFSAAIFGTEKEFELSHLETCEVCAGTGAKVGSKMRICSTCGGRGQVMRTEQTPFGMFSQVIIELLPITVCCLLFGWCLRMIQKMNLGWLLDILILFPLQLKIVKMKYMTDAVSKLSGHVTVMVKESRKNFLFIANACQ